MHSIDLNLKTDRLYSCLKTDYASVKRLSVMAEIALIIIYVLHHHLLHRALLRGTSED